MSVRLTPRGETVLAVLTDTLVLLIILGSLLLTAAILAPNGFHPTTPTRVSDLVIPPCVTEDAPGPCFWDAPNRGNGLGKSFVIDKHGVLTYK